MIFAFLGMIASAGMNIFDKMILGRKRLSFRELLPFSLTTSFVICMFFVPFFGRVDGAFGGPKYLLIFSAMIATSFFGNILFFYSMKKEELCDIEPFILMEGPITVIMAALIFPSERGLLPLIFTLIAAFALLVSRFNKRHFKLIFKKTTLALIIYVALVSVQAQFAKVLLEVMSPISLYAIRCGVLAGLYWMFLRPKVSRMPWAVRRNLVIDGAVSFVVFISTFYAIMAIGIVQTTLVFLLSPVLVLAFSKLYLKEHFTRKKAIADFVIIGCVAAILLIH